MLVLSLSTARGRAQVCFETTVTRMIPDDFVPPGSTEIGREDAGYEASSEQRPPGKRTLH